MGAVGHFGGITFGVSSGRVQTFDNFSLKQSIKTTTHDVIGWKGRTEVTGEELDEVTLDITLMASLGVRPRAAYANLRSMMHNKQISYLIVGNTRVMDRRCLITNITSKWEDIYSHGEVGRIECSITFKEYQ